MAYVKKTMVFPHAREVMEYHTARYGGPGQERQKKRKATPEEMEKRNQYNRERMARWKLRNNFDINDYFTCLTYKRDERPLSMAVAKEHFKKFIRRVRGEYKKRGAAVKWMRNIEVGTKNGWHVHLVINRIQDTDVILREAWGHGKAVNQLLHEKGEFAELAAYITKTPKTDARLKETDYSASRNLPVPEPETRVYRHWKTWKDVKVPGGYYLDKESLYEGINPVTGYKYRAYTLMECERTTGVRGNPKGRPGSGKEGRRRKAPRRTGDGTGDKGRRGNKDGKGKKNVTRKEKKNV